jgi:hypothetical protein
MTFTFESEVSESVIKDESLSSISSSINAITNSLAVQRLWVSEAVKK